MPEFSTNFKSDEFCKICTSPVWIKGDSTFCSTGCKSMIFRKRILLKCDGCSKIFSNFPYLKRKTNYCSMDCYWKSNRKKGLRKCAVCNKNFLVKSYLIKMGYGLFCSRECQHKTYPEKVVKACLQCGNEFSIWPSHSHLAKYCSKKCADDHLRDYVERICEGCKKSYQLPRFEINRGRGHFCTYACFKHYSGETSIEKKVRIVLENNRLKFKQEVKVGKRFFVDFLLEQKNLVIECDGKYWHSLKKAKDRDKRKNLLLRKMGYKILRLPEQLINNLSENKLSTLISANT